MANQNIGRILLIVLAVIGAVALIALLAMWLMMAGMMGGGMGMMDGEMMSCCQNMGAVSWGLGVLVIAGLVAAILLALRKF